MDGRACEHMAELVSAYADDELTAEESALVEAHLKDCPSCAARLTDYRRLQAGLKRYLASTPVPPARHNVTATTSGQGGRAMNDNDSKRGTRLLIPRLAAMTLAAVVVVALVVAAFGQFGSPAQPAQADEILDRAAVVADDPGAFGLESVELRRVSWAKQTNPRFGAVGQEIERELHLWWQAPNRWRLQVRPTGQADGAGRTINISDGQSVYAVGDGGKSVTINQWEPELDVLSAFSAVDSADVVSGDGGEADLGSLLKNARQCYEPRLIGEENVAGRAAYIVDLGPSKCPSASAPAMNGRRVVWVDKETFFELKSEQYATGSDEELIATSEVTSVVYNGGIDSSLFSFTPAADAVVRDYRPKPAPSAEDFQQQVRRAAERVDFPIFVPEDVPAGLQPRQPRLDPDQGPEQRLELAYVPTDQVETNAAAAAEGVGITQLKATPELVARWTESAEVVDIGEVDGRADGSVRGWLRRGVTDVSGLGSDSAALVVRDGTLISVNSFSVAPEELVRIAASLRPAPGSKPPLTDFVMPDLVETPATAPTPVPTPRFTILRPTWLPEPMTVREQFEAGPPEFGSSVVMGFDPRPAGSAPHDVVTLRQMPRAQAGDPGTPDPQESVENIGGREVSVIRRGDACITFRWEQDDVVLTLTNAYDPPGQPRYSCDQMRRIIESIQ